MTDTEMAAVRGYSIDRLRQILEIYVINRTPMADSAIRKWAAYEEILENQRIGWPHPMAGTAPDSTGTH